VHQTHLHSNEKDIPTYEVIQQIPENFEVEILDLQKTYLEHRKNNGGPPLEFNEKIIQLEAISLTKQVNKTRSDVQQIAWSALNLQEFYYLFSDKNVTDAFSSKIGNQIAISHRVHGRCRTNQVFRKDFWKALKQQSEIAARRIISAVNPTLKTGLMTPFGNFRISLQIPPRTINAPSFNIRRIPQKPIQLERLVQQNQISRKYAEILVSAVENRKNIVIAGEPGSGKTTLANALLLRCDPSWRVIIVEDATEINLPATKFPLSVRFSIPSIGAEMVNSCRIEEITKLLHRSPDYVFLGEIQNAQDTQAAFEGFAAGVRGMATTHARNIDTLLSRWKSSHQLSEDLFQAVDFVVVTSREFISKKFRLSVVNLLIQENGQFREV
jgi:type IV secretory pathway ATPase VirB11/archaellum biosynthesis ATPase